MVPSPCQAPSGAIVLIDDNNFNVPPSPSVPAPIPSASTLSAAAAMPRAVRTTPFNITYAAPTSPSANQPTPFPPTPPLPPAGKPPVDTIPNALLPAITFATAEEVTIMEITSRKERKGRHARFSPEKDLIVVHEVAAAKAHVVSYGTVSKKFEEAAEKGTENPLIRQKVTGKCVQDRYKTLQSAFDRSDKRDQFRSGVGGGAGEIDELLTMCWEARDDTDVRKRAGKRAAKELDDEKERVARKLTSMATSRRASDTDGDSRKASSIDSSGGHVSKAQRVIGPTGEMERFAIHFLDADMACIELDKEKLRLRKNKWQWIPMNGKRSEKSAVRL